MTKQNTNYILLIYNILVSISIVTAGIFLILGCLNIYYSGNGYSRELVAQIFSKICIPVYICLGLVVGSFIINAIIPSTHKPKPVKHYNLILVNLLKSRDISQHQDEFKKINKNKFCIKFANICIITLSTICFFVYAVNPTHFHQTDINNSMIKAMLILFPLLLLCFASAIISHHTTIKFTKKQIEILKNSPKKETVDDNKKFKSNEKNILIFKIVIVIAVVSVLLFGAFTGGFADVLTKAVNICTECIGLG